MITKLTLTLEQTVIEKAKNFAKSKRQSLSGLIENYLKALTSDEIKSDTVMTPLVKELKGSFHVSADFNYKKELAKSLSAKYK